MAIQYSITKHGRAFVSKSLCATGGSHIYNIKLTTACDNGNVIKRGAFIDLDSYEEAAASTMKGVIQKKAANSNYYIEITENPDHECFVYVQPFINEDWTNKWKAEENFYNEAGTYVRAYDLCVGDVVEVSAEGFTGTPEVGKEVTVAAKKFVVGD